jgi:hypothetical protein
LAVPDAEDSSCSPHLECHEGAEVAKFLSLEEKTRGNLLG